MKTKKPTSARMFLTALVVPLLLLAGPTVLTSDDGTGPRTPGYVGPNVTPTPSPLDPGSIGPPVPVIPPLVLPAYIACVAGMIANGVTPEAAQLACGGD